MGGDPLLGLKHRVPAPTLVPALWEKHDLRGHASKTKPAKDSRMESEHFTRDMPQLCFPYVNKNSSGGPLNLTFLSLKQSQFL